MNSLDLIAATIVQNLQKNWVAYEAAGGVLFVAFVTNMPSVPPTSMQEYWSWVRSALQTAIPAARARNNHEDPPPPPINPIPPAEPAQPSKEQ